MAAFKWFLEDFKAEDRHRFDLRRINGTADPVMRDKIETAYSRERPEKRMYQYFLERMRDTGQTNLNLDVLDILAFRDVHRQSQKKRDKEYQQLYRNLMVYPQEIIPILDQVLKDCALDWAWSHLGHDAATREENTSRAEAMESCVFKVRPIGGERNVNMRDLNPAGTLGVSSLVAS